MSSSKHGFAGTATDSTWYAVATKSHTTIESQRCVCIGTDVQVKQCGVVIEVYRADIVMGHTASAER